MVLPLDYFPVCATGIGAYVSPLGNVAYNMTGIIAYVFPSEDVKSEVPLLPQCTILVYVCCLCLPIGRG